ncbi:hypothetical protein LSPH24S_06167 [Lysinibacillus sphaericus]
MMEKMRPTPEELLTRFHQEQTTVGRLKIFIGYAAGVGKTYAMLERMPRTFSKKTWKRCHNWLSRATSSTRNISIT